MNWFVKRFGELTPEEVYEILRLRCDVFIVEQKCAYPDIDGRDPFAYHLFCRNEDGSIGAYLRILDPGQTFRETSVGRVLVRKDLRGGGLAKTLLKKAMDFTETVLCRRQIRIEAQSYLTEFYQSFGFAPCSDVFLEDGIPHIEMFYDGQ